MEQLLRGTKQTLRNIKFAYWRVRLIYTESASMKFSTKQVHFVGVLVVAIYVILVTVLYERRRSSCLCQSNDVWPRSLAVGRTQLEQYRHWRNLTKTKGYKKRTRDQAKYNYSINFIQPSRRCNDVIVRLDELYDKRRTGGGSSFLALIESHSIRYMCSFWDYFNGTYAICCPAPPIEYAVLTIRLQYVNFEAYGETIDPFDRTVLSRTIGNWNSDSKCQTRRHPNSPATWHREGGNWTVAPVHSAQGDAILDEKAICDCVKNKFDKFVMVGASHIRYKFDYLVSRCYGEFKLDNLERKHGSRLTTHISSMPCVATTSCLCGQIH